MNRDLQREILQSLAALYPQGKSFDETGDGIAQETLAAIQYLDEHGLVKSGFLRSVTTGGVDFVESDDTCITAKGLDFLAADGGLGAILNIVTVRLDVEQWRELLASKVQSAEGIPEEERSTMSKAIRELPAKAVEKLSERLLDWAVDHAADALPLLRIAINLGSG